MLQYYAIAVPKCEQERARTKVEVELQVKTRAKVEVKTKAKVKVEKQGSAKTQVEESTEDRLRWGTILDFLCCYSTFALVLTSTCFISFLSLEDYEFLNIGHDLFRVIHDLEDVKVFLGNHSPREHVLFHPLDEALPEI
jgi:hypothetical protein